MFIHYPPPNNLLLASHILQSSKLAECLSELIDGTFENCQPEDLDCHWKLVMAFKDDLRATKASLYSVQHGYGKNVLVSNFLFLLLAFSLTTT